MTTHHQTLGISENATLDEARKAYRKLAHSLHPDKPDGDAAMYSVVKEAWDKLQDLPQYKDHSGSIFDFPEFDDYRNFKKRHSPDSQWTDDFIKDLERKSKQNLDVTVVHHTVSLEDAYHGCNVNGQTHVGNAISFTLPPGTVNNGYMMVDHGGENNGKCKVIVHHKTHKYFFLDAQQNLRGRLTINGWQAIIGYTFRLKHLNGKSLDIKIPAGTEDGQKIRLVGQGWPSMDDPSQKTDLIVTCDVKFPKISDEESLEKLKTVLGEIKYDSES